MDKETVVNLHNGILVSLEKEENPAICHHAGGIGLTSSHVAAKDGEKVSYLLGHRTWFRAGKEKGSQTNQHAKPMFVQSSFPTSMECEDTQPQDALSARTRLGVGAVPQKREWGNLLGETTVYFWTTTHT